MRPNPSLLIAAAFLAAVHVVGVLFARPVLRAAEVLATLCLLAYAVRHDLLTGRHPAPGAYDGLLWRARLESLAPVAVALVFALVLLVASRRAGETRARPGRAVLGTGIASAVLAVRRAAAAGAGADRRVAPRRRHPDHRRPCPARRPPAVRSRPRTDPAIGVSDGQHHATRRDRPLILILVPAAVRPPAGWPPR